MKVVNISDIQNILAKKFIQVYERKNIWTSFDKRQQ